MTKVRKFWLAFALLALLVRPAHAINFPALLDDNTTLFNIVNGDVYIAPFHNNPKDAIIAIETKVGVDGSAVTTTLDYLLKNSASVDPGHKHTGTSVTFVDGSAATPGLRFGNPVTDTNTGVFHPGTGVIAVASGGVEKVRVNGTGLAILDSSGADFPLDVAGIVRIQGANSLCFGGTGAADNDTCVARSGANALTTTAAVTIGGNLTAGGAASTVNLANTVVSILDAATNTITIADVTNFVFDTGTGTKFGTATNQKISFYNATPIVQPVASTALVTALQNLGLIASGTFSGNIVTTGSLTLGTSGNPITRTLNNGAGTALDFAAPGVVPGCSADLTITVTGAATGDSVALGVPNASIADATQVFSSWVSAANTVTVRSCQLANAAANPASGTFKVQVLQQ